MKMNYRSLLIAAGVALPGCGGSETAPAAAPPSSSATIASHADALASDAPPVTSITPVLRVTSEPRALTSQALPLPGATGPASLDFIAYEPGAARVWVPVGKTGSVDVFDVATKTFRTVAGFKTVERDVRGKKRTFGPSAVSIGDGFAYIGNRGTSEVCPIDVKSLKLGACFKLKAAIDGVTYVASTKEVWVSTPDTQTLAILDASKPGALKAKSSVKVDGAPECYAVDESRGLFFTNLEDKGGTVVIDIKTRHVKATWQAGCDADGPRGLAFDGARNLVFVACSDHVQTLDAGHDGARLGYLSTGRGVDTIDYVPGKQHLVVAAGKAKLLTIAHVDDGGAFSIVATGSTSEGVRNAVGDEKGNAYVADAATAQFFVFSDGDGK